MSIVFLYVRQTSDAVDVDEVGGPGEPQLHHRNQALAAAQDLGFVAVLLEEGNRFGNARRPKVFKGWRNHGLTPSLKAKNTALQVKRHYRKYATADATLSQGRVT